MHSNLKLINPLKENELFSIHNYKKKIHSNFSNDSYFKTLYNPFSQKKHSLLSLKKAKKFGVTLTEIKHKNKTNYTTMNNRTAQIPYPSFPGNNKIPAIYKNSQKLLKYPKILTNNLTVYNFKRQNAKQLLLSNKKTSNSQKTIITYKKTQDTSTNTNSCNMQFLTINDNIDDNKNFNTKKDFNKLLNFENNNHKKKEIKRNLKINNFHNILNNIIHLIEIRDQNNNNIIYAEVTNLLLSEINKLIELQKKRKELLKRKEAIIKYKKMKRRKKKLRLIDKEDDSSLRKGKSRRKKSLKTKSVDVKFQKKYGFEPESIMRIKKELDKRDDKSEISSLISGESSSYDNPYLNFYRNKVEMKNESIQKSRIVEQKSNIYDNSKINNINNDKYNDVYRINKDNDISNNLMNNNKNNNNIYNIYNIYNNNNNFNNINNISKDNHKINSIISDDTTIKKSIFGNFILDNQKKNKKNEMNEREVKTDNFDISEIIAKMQKKEKLIKNQQKMKYSNFFKKNVLKMNASSSVEVEDTKDKIDKKKEMPLFEQMVNNYKLIKLIHNYMNYKKEDKIVEEIYEEEEKEENDEEEKLDKEKLDKEKKNEGNKNEENIIEDKLCEYKNDNINIGKEKEQKVQDKNKSDENEKEKEEEQKMEEEKDNNKNIKRRKKRAKTYFLQKIELGLEIIKQICKELNINKDVKTNLETCLFNLMQISRKEKKSEKENEFQKKLMKPMNEITEKFLENMIKINNSHEKPKGLFNSSLKSFLRDRLKEILSIGEYNEEGLEDEETNNLNFIHTKIENKEEKTKKTKKLIYDNSYFFKKKDSIKENIDNIRTITIEEDDNEQNKLLKNSASFDEIEVPTKFLKKNKFIKTKKLSKLIKLTREKDKKVTIETKKKNEEIKIKNEDILDKRLQAFFEKIKELKNIKESNDEEKLRIYIDKEVERFDYTQEKVVEVRKYNFFNDLKVARISHKNGKKYQNKKLLFHSPVIFNIFKK